MQEFHSFFKLCVCAKMGSWSQAFLAKTMETRDRNCDRSEHHALFLKKGKIDTKDVKLFWNRWVHKFYRLKALITLEQVNTSVITSMVRL